MKKITLLFLLTITITSCAPKIEYYSGNFYNPTVNTKSISELGDAIYTKEDLIYQPAVKIVSLPSEPVFKGSYPYHVGDIIPFSGKNNKQDVYSFKNEPLIIQGTQKIKSSNLEKFKEYGVVVDQTTKEAYPSFGLTNAPATANVKGLIIEPAKYVENNCENCVKQEFIYNGKSNNTLKFIYREFIKDMARPAFTQELQYDLNESNVIGFKGMRIEIINSTNTILEYKVLQNMTNL